MSEPDSEPPNGDPKASHEKVTTNNDKPILTGAMMTPAEEAAAQEVILKNRNMTHLRTEFTVRDKTFHVLPTTRDVLMALKKAGNDDLIIH